MEIGYQHDEDKRPDRATNRGTLVECSGVRPILAQCRSASILTASAGLSVIAQQDDTEWRVQLDISEGYYLYAEKLQVYSLSNGIKTPLPLAAGQTVDYPDPLFGTVAIIDQSQTVNLEAQPPQGELWVAMQGCSKQGLCYPPEQRLLSIVSD